MSQYQQYPPYPAHPYSYQPMYGLPDPQADLLRPARRASILMFILAGLLLSCGVCAGISSLMPIDHLDVEQRAPLGEMDERFSQSHGLIMGLTAGFVLLCGIGMLLLAIFVRRGGLGITLTSLILVGGLGLLLILVLVSNLVLAMQEPIMIVGACVPAIPLALIGLLGVWLIQAVRNAPRLAELRAGQSSAYWQSMQQGQQYGNSGYWPQQPPPPPPSHGE